MPTGSTLATLDDLTFVGAGVGPMSAAFARSTDNLTAAGYVAVAAGGVPFRSTAISRLLNAVPAYLDRDPAAELALDITPTATTATITIAQRVLAIRTTGGLAPSVVIPLEAHSLASLRTFLNGVLGYTVTLRTEDSTRSALCLIEIPNGRDLLADSRLYAFTSLLWVVLSPLAWALEDLQERIKQGLAQMTLKTAEGLWVDLWGEQYYGGVYRLFAEGDRHYADRIIREVLRWRLNRFAMAQIVWEELGIDASVTNLHDQAWVVGVTNFGYLVGRKYARTTFEVVIHGVSEDLWFYVERNRAAGTLPFIRYAPYSEMAIPIDFTPSGGALAGIVPRSELILRIVPGSASDYLLPVKSAVLGVGGGALFMLGGASVMGGSDTLGGAAAGMNIADVWSTPV